MFSLGLLCFLMFFSVGEVFAEVENITCFGDSITSGWSVYTQDGNGCQPPCGGYEPHLYSLLLADGRTIVLRNYGVGGEYTKNGASRIDGVLSASNPKYVLLLEGTNDALWFSPGTIITNLSYMIDRIVAHGATPVLATLTPDHRYNDAKPITEINRRIRNLATERNIALADLYAATNAKWSVLSSDGLHPNLSGYNVLADTWHTNVPVDVPETPEPEPPDPTPWLFLLLR